MTMINIGHVPNVPRLLRRNAKVAESVAQDIVRQIAVGGLEPGAQLSSETKMLADYGVGRGSLREALRILEIHGLISIKPGPGGGPVVAGVSTEAFGRMATMYFQVGGMTFRELIEARLIIEPVMARLAAERADPEKIEELIKAGEATETDDDEAYLRTSANFHWIVGSMSGNSILNLFSHSLEDIFHERVTSMLFPSDRRKDVASAHAAIARAIAKGQPAKAEQLMRAHMEEYAAYVEQRHPALMDEVVDWR
jgi:DNA-binding FadR family transcriptional regulator